MPQFPRYVRFHRADGAYSDAFLYPASGEGGQSLTFLLEGGRQIVNPRTLLPGASVGPPGIDFTIEESDDLVTWSTLAAGAVPGERPPPP